MPARPAEVPCGSVPSAGVLLGAFPMAAARIVRVMSQGGDSRQALLLRLWLPLFLYIGFIFWLSSAPRVVPGIRYFPWMDKVFHTLEYAPLGILWLRALSQTFQGPTGKIQLLAFIAALVVGALDEYYQRFTPLRFSSGWDLVWDGVGALLGQSCYAYWISKLAKTP